MTEREYIVATSLAQVRAMLAIVHSTQPCYESQRVAWHLSRREDRLSRELGDLKPE